MGHRNFSTLNEAVFPLPEAGSIPMRLVGLLLFATATLAAGLPAADAADSRYPDWPCAQAKVPELSVATMWDGPSIEQAEKTWQDDPTIKNLVEHLAARRIPIEEAQKGIDDFLAGAGAAKADKAVRLFAGLFETLNHQRTEVMNGLERLQRRQRELADRIKADVSAQHELQDKPQLDQAKIDELRTQIEWSKRIFDERRRSVRYACEVPIAIERRLFTLARTIRQQME